MSDYEPIDCADHDRLESLATLRQVARIAYRDDRGDLQELEDLIEDVFARDGVEYLKTAGGVEVRLDRLERVDGKRRADAGGAAAPSQPGGRVQLHPRG